MTVNLGIVSGIRISHDRATLDEIEAARRDCDTQRAVVEQLVSNADVEEAFALQTCNRIEAYVVTDEPASGRTVLSEFVPDVGDHAIVEMNHEECLRHLLRVAAGLESIVLGEDQIIGQVRDAYKDARAVGTVGPVLEGALTKALHVGERARTETAINEGTTSISSAAVALANQKRDLTADTALVIGAGEMGSRAATALADAPVSSLFVANRSLSHARQVVADLDFPDARAVGLDALTGLLPRVDVIISATDSDDYILSTANVGECGETLIIDIAQPRDIEPASDALSGVTIHDMEVLDSIIDETNGRRRAAVGTVEATIDREYDRLLEQYKRKRADEAIAAIRKSAYRIKTYELATALSKLEATDEFTDQQRAVVESLADSLVSKLLAAPTKSLRDAAAEDDWTTINAALRLFDPDFDVNVPKSAVTVPEGDAHKGTPSGVSTLSSNDSS